MIISGLFYSALTRAIDDKNTEIEDCIQWADELYKELCGNHGTAVVRLEYNGNVLKRVFYYILDGEILCQEEAIDGKVNNTILPEDQLEEIVKNGYITVKKY